MGDAAASSASSGVGLALAPGCAGAVEETRGGVMGAAEGAPTDAMDLDDGAPPLAPVSPRASVAEDEAVAAARRSG